jgi:S-DNA-T family DNA segregation ATPase FtsK/SpoIIIE
MILSLLYALPPERCRFIMVDPKMLELSVYDDIPHLLTPVVTDPRKAVVALKWAVREMENRYRAMSTLGVRNIRGYNDRIEEAIRKGEPMTRRVQTGFDPDTGQPIIEEQSLDMRPLPYIVIVVDEMADLMMTAGKDVEQHIIRLAQKSRAVGIHLILATQKPTVDVITGLIKSNLPARLAFQVASKTDSRVVLDENGAEKLLGNGDMLFLWPGTSTLLRGQGTFLGDEEIERVCDHCSHGEQNFVGELLNMQVHDDDENQGVDPGAIKKRDELYESAVDVVVREGRGSCSLLQRCLGIGYGRAARLIDYMAEDKIVGEYNGSQAREVLLSVPDWEAMQGIESSDPEEDAGEPPEEDTPENRPPAAHDPARDSVDEEWEDVD